LEINKLFEKNKKGIDKTNERTAFFGMLKKHFWLIAGFATGGCSAVGAVAGGIIIPELGVLTGSLTFGIAGAIISFLGFMFKQNSESNKFLNDKSKNLDR